MEILGCSNIDGNLCMAKHAWDDLFKNEGQIDIFLVEIEKVLEQGRAFRITYDGGIYLSIDSTSELERLFEEIDKQRSSGNS